MHFRLAQFADRQHGATSRYLESEEHAAHKELLALKHRSVEEMQRTIAHWKATGTPPSLLLSDSVKICMKKCFMRIESRSHCQRSKLVCR